MPPPAGSLRRNTFQQLQVGKPQHPLATEDLHHDVERAEADDDE